MTIDTYKESMEELKTCKCSGPHCNHETSEEHYLISEPIIRSHTIKLLEAKIVELEGMKKTYTVPVEVSFEDGSRCEVHMENEMVIGYNAALQEVINNLKAEVEELKKLQ